MSSTMTNGRGAPAGRVTDDVADFAAAVRRSLEDLPPDEVEELVDGLEADLIEGREDSGEPLGDPVAYADELRAAAGLPPRDGRPGGEWFGAYKRLWASGSAWLRETRQNPAVSEMLGFFVELRPVWWVLRGWAACRLVVMLSPSGEQPGTLMGWALLAAFVLVSVQWGRGRWMPWAWLRKLKTVVSVVVLFALPFAVGEMNRSILVDAYGNSSANEDIDAAMPSGLVNANGNSITNLFAFDCAGDPLRGVQLFDQDGKPLTLDNYGPDDDWVFGVGELGREIAVVPNPNTTGGSGWNVFPLLETEFDETYQADASAAAEPDPPFDTVQPLADAEETCATAEDEVVPDGGTDGTDGPSTETAPTEGGR